MIELVVTGTGRCGTGHFSQVLTQCGFHTGHEGIFTYAGPLASHPYRGDSSWMAAPFLDCLGDDVPVLHVFRHPREVIGSLLGTRFFTLNTWWREFAFVHLPQLRQMSPFEAACHFYCEWNLRIAVRANRTCEIVQPDWQWLSKATGVDVDALTAAAEKVGTLYNQRAREELGDSQPPQWVLDVYAALVESSTPQSRR